MLEIMVPLLSMIAGGCGYLIVTFCQEEGIIRQ